MSEPLFLDSPMHEKIWGGQRLATEFGYNIPSETTGEYWAISAHPNGVSTIKNGRFAGTALDQLYADHRELFGHDESPVFPLLTKILDANDWLSVQVHPDDTYALAHEGELGKTECWYVLAAEPGSEIVYGHEAETREQLEEMLQTHDWDHLLHRIKVKAGDFFYVPAGTLHAIGAGILILETQQSSDTTYRVYDFDRKDDQGQLRELHLAPATQVLNLGLPENSRANKLIIDSLQVTTFVSSPYFTVYEWQVSGAVQMQQTAPYLLVSVIEGLGELEINQQVYALEKGDHFILPSDVERWEFSGDLKMISSHI